MIGFSSLTIALFAIGALASPVEVKSVAERGAPDFVLGPHNDVRRRQATDYSQDYTTGGEVNFSPNGNSFTVTWDTTDDFVVGRGWTTGDTTPISFDGTFDVTSGVGLLSIYGWTTSPLVEYYIMEDTSNPPQQGTIKGTFTSDGGTYTVWENQRVNEPSIIGTATFNQYISIRSSSRSSGTVTLENHFKQWASYGMSLGSFNYQCLAVETWSGSGSASQTVSKGGSSGTGSTTTTTSAPATSTTSTGSSGSCSSLWGQCGGIGWTGATCCSSGSCKESNSYYSQCLS